MFSKLSRVSNLFPQSARDAMSFEVVDLSLFSDKLSRGGASSLESLRQHYSISCDEVATLHIPRVIKPEPTFSSHGPHSPGAPAGDHHRHSAPGKRKKSGRNTSRHVPRDKDASSPRTTKSNTTTTKTGSYKPNSPSTENGRGRRAKRHSAPCSAENTARKPDVKIRTRSAKPEERCNTTSGSGISTTRGSHEKSHNHRPNTKENSSSGNKNKQCNRKSTNGNIRSNGQAMQALSSSELIVARHTALDSQRQMRQKAKIAIAMWKERMTKKRKSSTPRLATCRGCFPPLTLSEETTRNPDEWLDHNSLSQTRQLVSRHYYQDPAASHHQSPRIALNNKKLEIDDIMDVSPLSRSPLLSPGMGESRIDILESTIPRSSSDDLSATDESKHSVQKLTITAGIKRNSASSHENQRMSKIPRPADGQGDKVKQNDSVETTSILSSSSEKEVTSEENIISMIPEDLLSQILPSSSTSPLLTFHSALSSGGTDKNAQEFIQVQQLLQVQKKLHQQPVRTVLELAREKRCRRGGHRLLHWTDDDEDDWPESPSTASSLPIAPPRSKPLARHHARRSSPKPVAPPSPPTLLTRQSSSGGDADTVDTDGMMCDRRSSLGFSSWPDSDVQSSAVVTPRRKPYLHRKMMLMKLGGLPNDSRDFIRKRQRQEIYALNQVTTALEFARFEHFCRTRKIPLSV